MLNVNCPYCKYCVQDINACSIRNQHIADVEDPNVCPDFTCSTDQYRSRFFHFLKLIGFVLFIAFMMFLAAHFQR